jgi:repressor LexA
MASLTPRQDQILQFIRQSLQEKGFSPTVREIGRHFGISSPNAVHGHVKALREKGFLDDTGSAHRALRLPGHKPSLQIPLLGRVRAGAPILAEENVESYLTVDKDVAKGAKLFALRVTGDSMKDAGILDKDAVIVRQQSDARNGDIVVALKDDEATVKYYRQRRGRFFLEPANPAYSPFPASDYSLIGIVRGLLRSYAP